MVNTNWQVFKAELLSYLPCHVASNYVEVSIGCLGIYLHSIILLRLILECISMVDLPICNSPCCALCKLPPGGPHDLRESTHRIVALLHPLWVHSGDFTLRTKCRAVLQPRIAEHRSARSLAGRVVIRKKSERDCSTRDCGVLSSVLSAQLVHQKQRSCDHYHGIELPRRLLSRSLPVDLVQSLVNCSATRPYLLLASSAFFPGT